MGRYIVSWLYVMIHDDTTVRGTSLINFTRQLNLLAKMYRACICMCVRVHVCVCVCVCSPRARQVCLPKRYWNMLLISREMGQLEPLIAGSLYRQAISSPSANP